MKDKLNWSQNMTNIKQSEEEHRTLLYLPHMVQNMSKSVFIIKEGNPDD